MRGILGFVILLAGAAAVPPASAQLTSLRIGRVQGDNMEGEDEYLTTDPKVEYSSTFNAHKGDKMRIEWWSPTGGKAQSTPDQNMGEGNGFNVWHLDIAGAPASLQPGAWQVRTYWNGDLVNVTKFRISLPPDGPVQFLTNTVLPYGTVGQPYYLQLTARGGTPRYRWTTVKALPAGLALSADGVVTGTPQARGGFRGIVKAEDSAGNSMTRGVGISVSVPSPVKVVSRSLLKATGADTCSTDTVETSFAAADSGIAIAVRLDAGTRPGNIEWLNPRGEIAQHWDFRKSKNGPECLVNTLAVAGHPAASDPGDWRVRVYCDGEAFTLKFSIKASTGVTASSAQGRIAFLIANRSYQKMPATGPPDADLGRLETALRDDGFQVNPKTNLTLKDLVAFEKSLGAAIHSGDTVFVYYAGHGIPSGGDLWLVPVDYDPRDARPIESKAYSVLRLRDVLEDSKAKLKFLVLDASRQGTAKGLGAAAADSSTTIVESGGSHSGAFARALAQTLALPGAVAKTALETDLPNAVVAIELTAPRPGVFIGGGGSFVFRAVN